MITLYIIICHKKKRVKCCLSTNLCLTFFTETLPPPSPHTHDTPGFKTIWVPTHRGTLYPKREEKSVWGRWVSQRRPEKGKLSLGFILLDYWLTMDEWVVAEKAIPMGMKKRIKERSWCENDTKTNIHKKITNNIPNNHFVKKGGKRPKLRLSRRANHNHSGWGEEHNKARTIFLLYVIVHDLDRDIVVGLLLKLFELICYVPNLLTTTHKLILRESRCGKVVFLVWPIISGDWGPKLFWILVKACINYSREGRWDTIMYIY